MKNNQTVEEAIKEAEAAGITHIECKCGYRYNLSLYYSFKYPYPCPTCGRTCTPDNINLVYEEKEEPKIVETARYGKYIVEGQCSGNCCRVFNIGQGLTIEELKSGSISGSHELNKIIEMLIPLTEKEIEERKDLAPLMFSNKPEYCQPGMLFTCKHFNDVTGKCNDYENRPDMCRDYPYRAGRCAYKDCTYKYLSIEEETENTAELKTPLLKELE